MDFGVLGRAHGGVERICRSHERRDIRRRNGIARYRAGSGLKTPSARRVRECLLPPCARRSGDVVDHLDELVGGVSLSAGELDELVNFLHDGAAFGCPGDGDAAAAAKLEQSFVLEHP